MDLYTESFFGFLLLVSFFAIPIILTILVFLDSRKLENRGVKINPIFFSAVVFVCSLILAMIFNFEFWIFQDYLLRSIMSLIPGLIYFLIRKSKTNTIEEKSTLKIKKSKSIIFLVLIIVIPLILLLLGIDYLLRDFTL